MVELASIEGARRDKSGATTLPGRLRSALTARGWVRRPEPRVRFGQPVFPGVASLGPAQRDAAAAFVAEAAAVRKGTVTHLGRSVRFGKQVDWFPRGTSPAWQQALNAHDELLAIAVAGATAADPAERRAWYDLAKGLVRDWMRQVPAGHPVAWTVPPLARRLRNHLLMSALFATELRGDVETRRELLVSLYDQAGALVAATAKHAPGPWLVAAGQALLLAGRFFDGMEARSWIEAATVLLWGRLRDQGRDDGAQESRSPGWQAFVLAEYLGVLAILRADNDDIPVWGRKHVKGMTDALARIVQPGGLLPEFGPTPVDGTWPVAELLATAAVVLHDPAFAQAPELPGIWPLLLLGESGRRTYAGFTRSGEIVPEARAVRRTGYYVLAGGPGDMMVLDGGAHPCSDGSAVFGYELAVGGLPLVVGSRVTLEEDGAVPGHARTRRARNVLVPARLSGEPEGEIEGRFTVREGVQYFLGTAKGFAGLGADIQYRRRVFCLPGRFWFVCDEITGRGTFAGETLVHFHPDVTVRAACAGKPVVTIARSGASAVSVLVTGVRSVGLVGGATKPDTQGWYATAPGVWAPAPAVVLRVNGSLPLTIAYALVPGEEGATGEIAVESDAFELRAGVRLGATVYEITAVQDEVGLLVRPA